MAVSVGRYVNGAWRRIRGFVAQQRFLSRAELWPRGDLVSLGTEYGGWVIPQPFLDESSVCYLAGVGADASFDLALIERYSCQIYAFDPAPRSREYVEREIETPRFDFRPFGLSDRDGDEVFYAPDSPTGISLLAYGTDVAGTFPVRSVRSLMDELGHEHVDLLKLCTEGFENRIVASLLRDGVRPAVLCVEFARNNRSSGGAYRALVDAGYGLVHANVRAGNDWKLTFIRTPGERADKPILASPS